ncbi:ABC transporter permease subunit [Deinococcus ruber]|uniref:ABC transporter permease n=1 Tax=Deinococcus ruber TaxID=1848197 RepID=A0A918FA57_9DEIO|nr:ABC transporter permease subunit [Deinococcus ruber]GGR20208.1 ABC transporter permease [Deinococcus ruber]
MTKFNVTQDALTGAITGRSSDAPPSSKGAAPLTRRTRQAPVWRSEALRWLLPLALLLVWQVASSVGWLNVRVLPAPLAVVLAAWELLRNGQLEHHFLISLARAGTGVLIGSGLGLTLGLLNGTSRPAYLLLDSSFQMLRTIPSLALIPLVIVWFGIGESGKVFLIVLATFFPVYLNTLHGVRSIDARLTEMARVYGLGARETFRRVILPGALPSVLVGLRYALGISWLALVVSESFGASSGIGFLAMDAREFFRTDVIVLSIVIYALIGKVADALVRGLERRLLPWQVQA